MAKENREYTNKVDTKIVNIKVCLLFPVEVMETGNETEEFAEAAWRLEKVLATNPTYIGRYVEIEKDGFYEEYVAVPFPDYQKYMGKSWWEDEVVMKGNYALIPKKYVIPHEMVKIVANTK